MSVNGLGAFSASPLCLSVIPDGVLSWFIVQVALRALPLAEGDGVKHSPPGSTPNQPEFIQQNMLLKLNQNMWEDLLKHQESPEMAFDTTRL